MTSMCACASGGSITVCSKPTCHCWPESAAGTALLQSAKSAPLARSAAGTAESSDAVHRCSPPSLHQRRSCQSDQLLRRSSKLISIKTHLPSVSQNNPKPQPTIAHLPSACQDSPRSHCPLQPRSRPYHPMAPFPYPRSTLQQSVSELIAHRTRNIEILKFIK